jgi:hypothetical protein
VVINIDPEFRKRDIVACLQYKCRIENGFDLNFHKRSPERVESYSGITKQGALELVLKLAKRLNEPNKEDMD